MISFPNIFTFLFTNTECEIFLCVTGVQAVCHGDTGDAKGACGGQAATSDGAAAVCRSLTHGRAQEETASDYHEGELQT